MNLDIFETLQMRLGIALAVMLLMFYSGWKVHSWKTDAAYKKELEKQIAAKEESESNNRILVKHLQDLTRIIENQKDNRNGKIPQVTDGRICFANLGALQLWNEALLGESNVPKTPTGPTSSTTGSVATDTDVLRNLNENAARWQKDRARIQQIIEWDKKNFGERK